MAKKKYSRTACDVCRLKKRGCDRLLPSCSRCERARHECTYAIITTPSSKTDDGHTDCALAARILYGLSFEFDYPVPYRNDLPLLISHFTSDSLLPLVVSQADSISVHIQTTWMRRAMNDPCLFHATLFCASAHIDGLRFQPHSRRTMYHQLQAVKLLRERLADVSGPINYELAATALSLCYFSMSGFNAEAALTHREGLLRMLQCSEGQKSEFKYLIAQASLTLLSFSMILKKNITYPSSFHGGPQNDITQCACFPPSGLLRDAVTREMSYCHVRSTLDSSTLYEMQTVLDFIVQVHEGAITCEVPGKAGYTTPYLLPTSKQLVIQNPLHPIEYSKMGAPKAAMLSHACQLAISIFWCVFQHSTNIHERLVLLDDRLRSLKQILRKLDPIFCKRYAPEAYAWLSFTAAVACTNDQDRIGLIMIPMPVITACDSTDLTLMRKSWRYVKWLTEVHERNWSGMSTWDDE
ncbi:hypothetical protein BJX62DRAFT_38338 [Aspergillus germanicus]